jgi:sporulation protein YlmC with PRC-barrel domain
MLTTTGSGTGVISSKRVEGTTVYGTDGDKLGSIDELMIDKTSGQVRYAALEFGGFLGIGSDRYPLPWSTLKYDVEKGGYVVAVTKSQLEGAPRYETGTPPDYTDEYRGGIDRYYGL